MIYYRLSENLPRYFNTFYITVKNVVVLLIYEPVWSDWGFPMSCLQCLCPASARVPNCAPESVYIPEADIQCGWPRKTHFKLAPSGMSEPADQAMRFENLKKKKDKRLKQVAQRVTKYATDL